MLHPPGGIQFLLSFVRNAVTLCRFLSLSFPICKLSGQTNFLWDLRFAELRSQHPYFSLSLSVMSWERVEVRVWSVDPAGSISLP